MFSYTLKKNTTPFLLVSLSLFLISALCLLLFVLFPIVADAINDTVAQAVRLALAKVTSLLPFSFAELLICLSPILVALLIVIYIKCVHTRSAARRFFLNILAVLFLVGALYVFTIGPGYHTTRLDDKLGLEREKIEKEELLAVANHLHKALLSDLDEITFDEHGASQMPYTMEELSRRASEAYDVFVAEYPDLLSYNYHSRLKGVYFSRAMSYAHILGIYTFFTGEANVNIDYPDAEIPTTSLHEMAHQRGISREDEASFVAFLIGRESTDAYIRYSSNFDLFRYVLNAIWRADRELYREFFSTIDARIVGDIRAISNHSKQFDNNPIGNISSSLNDAYLKANGTEGAVSYGFIVDLAVAFYKENYPSLFS